MMRALKAYNDWVEQELLDPLRILRPALYQAIVRQLEVFIESGINETKRSSRRRATTPGDLCYVQALGAVTVAVLASGKLAQEFKFQRIDRRSLVKHPSRRRHT